MISVIAHRGASAVRPENTLEAFAEAARLGADGVELDVRLSADGALVVRHDAALPDGRAVANVGAAELPDDVPLLEAALDGCHGMAVNVEIKNLPHEPGWDPEEAIAAHVARVVAERRGRFVVSAFTVATIDAVRSAEPSVPTGLLTLAGYDQLAAVTLAAEGGHAALHPHHEGVTAEVVAAAHGAGAGRHHVDGRRPRAHAGLGRDGRRRAHHQRARRRPRRAGPVAVGAPPPTRSCPPWPLR